MNRSLILFVVILSLTVAGIAGCGGSSASSGAVNIQANGPTAIDQGQSLGLTATTGKNAAVRRAGAPLSSPDQAGATGVTWAITSGPGSLANQTSTSVTFQAPATVTSAASTVVTAASAANPSASSSITITTNPPPAVTTMSLAAAAEFTTVSDTLAASGGSGTLTWAAAGGTNPPAGLKLNSNGTVTGSPTGPSGAATFQVTVTDSANPPVASAAQTISVNISEPPAPSIAPASLPDAVEGTQYNQTVTITQGHAPYTITVNGNLPAGLSSSISNSTGTVILTGNATGPAATTANFSVNVADSSNLQQNASQNLSIKVDNPPAPMFTTGASLPAASDGVAYSQAISASQGLPPYSFAITSGALPNGLTGTSANNQFIISGTPNDAAKTFSITVQLTDSSNPKQQVSQTFTLVLNPAPPLSLAPASLPDGTEGTAYSQNLTASGGLPPYSFSPTANLPAGLTQSANGATLTISGTPTGPAGQANFTVQVSDSSNPKQTAKQTYTPNIKLPPAPTLSPATLPDGNVGVAYSQQVSVSNGLAPYTFSVTGTVPPGLNTSNGATAVTISGTPTTAETGDQFTVSVTDSSNPAQNAKMSYTVNITNTPPACLLLGQYALLMTGANANGAASLAASVTVANNGSATGAADYKDHKTLLANQAISSASSSCTNGAVANTGTLKFVIGSSTETFDVAMRADGVSGLVNWSDSQGASGSGLIEQQVNPSLNFHGNFGYGFQGEDASSGRLVEIGAFCSNGQLSVGFSQADIDDNENAQFLDNGTGNPAYTAPDSNGRSTTTTPFAFVNGGFSFNLTL